MKLRLPIVLAIAAACHSSAAAQEAVVAFVGVNVVPMDRERVNLQEIAGVMTGGRWHSRADIDRMLAGIAALHRAR